MERKPKMVLKVVESMTRPGVKYEIRLGHDGRVYCNCPASRFGGLRCKHLEAFKVGLQAQTA